MRPTLHEVYEKLLAHYGPQGWWPAASPFEMMVGAILTQNTKWSNVARAIDNLRESGVLEPRAMYALHLDELAELIQPSGSQKVKAKRLHNLLRLVVERYEGSLEAMFDNDRETLREQLLAVNGIGPETADAILLYAGQMPTFVIDAYTHRILARHGWVDFETDYDNLKDFFESELERDAALYNEYHGLLVKVGSEHCRKTPICDGCPLQEWLPECGPLSPPEW